MRTPEKDAGPAGIPIRVSEERRFCLLLKGEREQGSKKKNIFRREDFAGGWPPLHSKSWILTDVSTCFGLAWRPGLDEGGAAVAEGSRTERRGTGESQSGAKPAPLWPLRKPRCSRSLRSRCSGSRMGPKTRQERDGAENLLRRFQRTLGEPGVTFILLSLRPPPRGVPSHAPWDRGVFRVGASPPGRSPTSSGVESSGIGIEKGAWPLTCPLRKPYRGRSAPRDFPNPGGGALLSLSPVSSTVVAVRSTD